MIWNSICVREEHMPNVRVLFDYLTNTLDIYIYWGDMILKSVDVQSTRVRTSDIKAPNFYLGEVNKI